MVSLRKKTLLYMEWQVQSFIIQEVIIEMNMPGLEFVHSSHKDQQK